MPKIEMDMPELPEGWEYTGEYLIPDGRPWFDGGGLIQTETVYTKVPIVRRVQRWRPAKLDYLDKFAKCRVRDKESDPWKEGQLTGWNSNAEDGPWLIDRAIEYGWRFCEVLDK